MSELIAGETSGPYFVRLSHAPPAQAPNVTVLLHASTANVTFSPAFVVLTTAQASFSIFVAAGTPTQTVVISGTVRDTAHYAQPLNKLLSVSRYGTGRASYCVMSL